MKRKPGIFVVYQDLSGATDSKEKAIAEARRRAILTSQPFHVLQVVATIKVDVSTQVTDPEIIKPIEKKI